MAETYLLFDFGADEEKVQQARHKLDGWRQAFRLDKKLQFKLDRGEPSTADEPAQSDKPAQEASKAKNPKPKAKNKPAASETNDNREIKLLVRLYFSPHERLSEQRWIDRIPSEEPFKGATPKVVRENAPEFDNVLSKFDNLD